MGLFSLLHLTDMLKQNIFIGHLIDIRERVNRSQEPNTIPLYLSKLIDREID